MKYIFYWFFLSVIYVITFILHGLWNFKILKFKDFKIEFLQGIKNFKDDLHNGY